MSTQQSPNRRRKREGQRVLPNEQTVLSTLTYCRMWNSVRFALTPPAGATGLKYSTNPFDAVMPSNILDGDVTPSQLTTRIPRSPSE